MSPSIIRREVGPIAGVERALEVYIRSFRNHVNSLSDGLTVTVDFFLFFYIWRTKLGEVFAKMMSRLDWILSLEVTPGANIRHSGSP